jgi:hypothetical protein
MFVQPVDFMMRRSIVYSQDGRKAALRLKMELSIAPRGYDIEGPQEEAYEH